MLEMEQMGFSQNKYLIWLPLQWKEQDTVAEIFAAVDPTCRQRRTSPRAERDPACSWEENGPRSEL